MTTVRVKGNKKIEYELIAIVFFSPKVIKKLVGKQEKWLKSLE